MAFAQSSTQLTGDELFAFVLDEDISAFLAADAIVVWIALVLAVLFILIRIFGGSE